MKTLLWVCLSGTLVFGGAAAADPNLLQETVVKTALEENPKVKAAQAKWEMMKARVPQAIAWEDLRVGVDSVAGRFVSIPANAFMNQTVTVEQELPVSGKNRSRARAATAEAGAAFEEFRRAELDVVSRARGSYSRLANGYAQLEVNRRNEELLLAWCETNSRKSRPLLANTRSTETKFSRLRAKPSTRARWLTKRARAAFWS